MNFVPIGSADYDLESTDISAIVNYSNNREDPLILHAIVSIYSARILTYLDGIRKVFNQGYEALKGNTYFMGTYNQYVLPYLDPELKKTFDVMSFKFPKVFDQVMRMHNQFITMEGGKMDQRLLLEIFEILSRALCLTDTQYFTRLIDDRVKDANLFPFLSNTGHFGINSFLYAYFNGVFLLGFPISFSTYDNLYGCSYKFAEHDISHYHGMTAMANEKSFDFELLKKYYSSVVSSGIETWEKELCLSVLFMSIHEYQGYTGNLIFDISKILKSYGLGPLESIIEQCYSNMTPYSREVADWVKYRISDDRFSTMILQPNGLNQKYATIFAYFEMTMSKLNN